MLKGLVAALAAFLASSGIVVADEKTVGEFEQMAMELPYLSTESVIYGRPYVTSRFFAEDDPFVEEAKRHNQVLLRLAESGYVVDELRELLSHDSPQVRTLGAIALFNLFDAAILPDLLPLTKDDSQSFPQEPALVCAPRFSFSSRGAKKEALRKQTVADVVNQLFKSYMLPAGYGYGLYHRSQPGFAAYWQVRRDRSFCATWFGVQLAHASGNDEKRIARIRNLRTKIDQLSPSDRTWTLLWLHYNPGAEHLVTEAELVEMCRKQGPEKIVALLQYQIASKDPDLQPRRSNNSEYNSMARFVLKHAEQLLDNSDSAELLRCEHRHRDSLITPLWSIAAARLQPTQARQILRDSFQRFESGRARSAICSAAWQLVGVSESERIVDWFYGQQPDRGTFSHAHAKFIQSLGTSVADRGLVGRIVRDDRYKTLDWQTITELVGFVNRDAESPVVSAEELHSAWHPLGMGHFHWEQEKAETKYPRETKELRAQLSQWRATVRDYLQQ